MGKQNAMVRKKKSDKILSVFQWDNWAKSKKGEVYLSRFFKLKKNQMYETQKK